MLLFVVEIYKSNLKQLLDIPSLNTLLNFSKLKIVLSYMLSKKLGIV